MPVEVVPVDFAVAAAVVVFPDTGAAAFVLLPPSFAVELSP